ncbi:MAG: UDP-N-acetyl-D-glucosamine dehydrogenase, partial [Rhodothermales bacterium]|nr:UDP-N-acetyl-D-glucosamine dehydrogenase [Rhodothermales bacterium]
YWVRKVQEALNDDAKALRGSRVLVLGVAYKKNVSDVRESPAIDIISLLAEGGADVRYHDPYVEHLEEDGVDLHGVSDLDSEVRAADCIVIVTDHSAYEWDSIAPMAKKVVDTRGVA